MVIKNLDNGKLPTNPLPPVKLVKKEPKTKIWLIILLLILFLAAAAGCAWSYNNYLMAQRQITYFSTFEGQQQLAKEQIKQLVTEVGRLILLPTDEEPTVATILDAAALAKDQPFYKDAKNGDKVIIYVKAKKAIVYDSVRKILVNVGPIFVNDNNQTRNNTPAAPETPATGANIPAPAVNQPAQP